LVRREDRANRLAGGGAAMLAQHGQVTYAHVAKALKSAVRRAPADIVDVAIGHIALEAKPRHDAAANRLLLAHDRDVVLEVAGRDAGAAARAAVEVDAHPPAIRRAGLRVVGGIE